MENKQSAFLIPLAIVIAGLMVATAIYFGGDTSGRNLFDSGRADTQSIDLDPVSDQDHIRGSRNAPIIVIEYSDIECPFCKVFHNTMKQVLADYGNQVSWVYRHFPIPQLHANAIKEAEATECAAELGGANMFWTYVDKVFETTNSNDSLDLAELPRIAGDLGLNVDLFNDCLESGKYQTKIQDHIKSAIDAGARGTPYSVIIDKKGNQTIINGAEPLASVKAKIDAMLK